MNANASMVEQLREAPGAYGLITANGGYLTKHASGVYSVSLTTSPGSCPIFTRFSRRLMV